ncbi:hypothetical protein Pla123a_28730 [Posidoniimonas polymericola]|uniref:Membrane or secreted protein n=1 Tax=Posidoniimonas polymericola TaxID=2528002 RepID=A0A5C5YMJ4_9BACT|nr:membrane or secreted protein [Posidoniimonas polymericola]TWT76086.1 hypothetical protein Pla123a_28730 [Posidoniimonas polymericola]
MRRFPRTQRRRQLSLSGSLAVAIACCTGCGAGTRMPSLFHPGTAGQQQYDAIYHDPYPLNDVAPEIVGGRPREYQREVPQVTRGRLFRAPQASSNAY